jgi:hypothetical protein
MSVFGSSHSSSYKTTCSYCGLMGHVLIQPHTPHLPMGMWCCGLKWLWLWPDWAKKNLPQAKLSQIEV